MSIELNIKSNLYLSFSSIWVNYRLLITLFLIDSKVSLFEDYFYSSSSPVSVTVTDEAIEFNGAYKLTD